MVATVPETVIRSFSFVSYFLLFSLLIFVVWFTSTPVGHDKLGNVVSKMCKDADLQGQFSNHSLRATTATRGLEKGISDTVDYGAYGPPRYQIFTKVSEA